MIMIISINFGSLYSLQFLKHFKSYYSTNKQNKKIKNHIRIWHKADKKHLNYVRSYKPSHTKITEAEVTKRKKKKKRIPLPALPKQNLSATESKFTYSHHFKLYKLEHLNC